MLNFNFDFAKLTGSMFRVLDNVALDLQSGKMGIAKTGESLAVYDPEKKTIFESPFVAFAMAVPVIAVRTKLEDLREGDLIVNGEKILFVLEAEAGGGYIRTLDTDGVRNEQQPIAGLFFQDGTILAAKNTFGGVGGGMNLESMLPMLMMSQMTGKGGSQDQMKNLMMMSMLPQLMGGGSANGPMGGVMQMMMFSQLLGDNKSEQGKSGRGPF